jgi:hypothetical protein
LISKAQLANDKLDNSIIERLEKSPIEGEVDISDPDTRLSIDLYFATSNASEKVYDSVRRAVMHRFPETHVESYHQVKKLVSSLTGIVEVREDMCINSCHAFTGPFEGEDVCTICGESRWDPIRLEKQGKRIPRLTFPTFPLGPILQALWRSKESAAAMLYRHQKTIATLDESVDSDLVYDDIFSGSQYAELIDEIDLSKNDVFVSFSIDGAQLYKNKKSDTYIAIFKIENLPPSVRFLTKSSFIACIIPGPAKPKILESFVFRTFYHLSALQRANDTKGIRVWDATTRTVVDQRTIFALALADALALPDIDGRVGHHGALACRLGCKMKGRHKPNSGHYYAAHLRPRHYTVESCNHEDFDFTNAKNLEPASVEDFNSTVCTVINSTSRTAYERNRKATGISKPSLLLGLYKKYMFPFPRSISLDLMHLIKINICELLIPLWRGTIECAGTDDIHGWQWRTLIDDTWIAHGDAVVRATKYFPSSFHRPPRNPVEKINSGYKATEYFLYIFCLCPGLLRGILPSRYWRNFCLLVAGVRIILQRSVTQDKIRAAHKYLVQFVDEYEKIYYQRRVDRLHFCRPCLHTLLHSALEIFRVGPGLYSTQFLMERIIGFLGAKVRQPSNPFANLANQGLRLCEENCLRSMCPELNSDTAFFQPRGSHDIGNRCLLLRPRERAFWKVPRDSKIADAFTNANIPVDDSYRRWGRMRLPNGQISRSLWSESRTTRSGARVSRNVKVCIFYY